MFNGLEKTYSSNNFFVSMLKSVLKHENDITFINVDYVIRKQSHNKQFINLLLDKGLDISTLIIIKTNSWGDSDNLIRFINNIDVKYISDISNLYLHEGTYAKLMMTLTLSKLDILLENCVIHLAEQIADNKLKQQEEIMNLLNNYGVNVYEIMHIISEKFI